MAKPGTDLVKLETPDDAIDALRGKLVVTVEDPEVVATQIMERILSAESAAEVLGGSNTIPAQEVVDRPFTLNAVHYMKSSFDAGLPVFAVMNASMLDDGTNLNITSSARNVCAQAAMLWKLSALPADVVIRKTEKASANGYHVYYMEAV